jgi:hypothetical protein
VYIITVKAEGEKAGSACRLPAAAKGHAAVAAAAPQQRPSSSRTARR